MSSGFLWVPNRIGVRPRLTVTSTFMDGDSGSDLHVTPRDQGVLPLHEDTLYVVTLFRVSGTHLEDEQ